MDVVDFTSASMGTSKEFAACERVADRTYQNVGGVAALARMRSADRVRKRPTPGVDRTYSGHHDIDAFDPNQTWRSGPHDMAARTGWRRSVVVASFLVQ